eukprot:SAG31_NODE_16854_length_693_cov_0.720539_2_plen_81_part_00
MHARARTDATDRTRHDRPPCARSNCDAQRMIDRTPARRAYAADRLNQPAAAPSGAAGEPTSGGSANDTGDSADSSISAEC